MGAIMAALALTLMVSLAVIGRGAACGLLSRAHLTDLEPLECREMALLITTHDVVMSASED